MVGIINNNTMYIVADFINVVGTLARKEYLTRSKWILPSVCIAQAALESGFNLGAKTLFGIKGTGNRLLTSEFYNGKWVQVQDSFRAYPNVAAAVKGYYDFLSETPRYAKVLNERDYHKAVDGLIHTLDGCPYATDPFYVSKVISIIQQYNLSVWDKKDSWHNGIDYSDVYDKNFYDTYQDLQTAFGGDAGFLIQHFVEYGMREGRQGCAEFNVQVYRDRYSDLQDAFKDDLPFYYYHFINYGKAEGRKAV